MRIALAQLECVLGDVDKNVARATEAVVQARSDGSDLVVFPELFLSGYSLGKVADDVALDVDDERIISVGAAGGVGTATLLGFQEHGRLGTYNSAAYLEGDSILHVHRKAYLATYDVFEEAKHFTPGSSMRAFDTRLTRMATLICYDAWQPALVFVAAQDGAQVLLIPSNSTNRQFTSAMNNETYWKEITRLYASIFECYVVFVNRVGSEDELKFWGGSHIVDPHGRLIAEGPRDDEAIVVADIDLGVIRRRRREIPLMKEPRLGLLIKEMNRLAAESGHL